MNLFLSDNEKKIKEWAFIDKDNGLEFNNNIVVTDKRFIYQKELANSSTQRSVSRYDVGIDNIKGVTSFYGARQSKLWLILGIVGVFMLLLSIALFATEEIETGIFMLLIGIVLSVVGFYLHKHPDKSPIKLKSPNFSIKLETKTPEGSVYSLGTGQGIILRGKRKYSIVALILLTMLGVWPGVLYYFLKTRSGSEGLCIPEDIAIEIVETLGSVIF